MPDLECISLVISLCCEVWWGGVGRGGFQVTAMSILNTSCIELSEVELGWLLTIMKMSVRLVYLGKVRGGATILKRLNFKFSNF